MTFEEAQKELEEIVRRLERGEELYRFCRERLEAAEGRIEELASRVQDTKATNPEKP